MDAITRKVFGEYVPFDIYLLVLDHLNTLDISFGSSLALLNLSLTSRINARIIRDWASIADSNNSRKIQELERDVIPPRRRTNLAVLCRRLGGLCTICDNRAKLLFLQHPKDELFEGILLCRPCDRAYFPKISLARILHRYQVREEVPGNPSIQQLLRMCRPRATDYYNWADFYPLTQHSLDVSAHFVRQLFGSLCHTNEEFGGYFPPNQESLSDLYWPKVFILEDLGALEGLDQNGIASLPPYKHELLMLNHFRYRFDPKWRDMSDEQKFRYHLRIIKAWASDTSWIERPWRLDNFPLTGRAGAPLIMISSPESLKDELDYREYQSTCAKIKGVMGVFPNILLYPYIWKGCAESARDAQYATNLASYIYQQFFRVRRWTLNELDFDMEITKQDGRLEVDLVQRQCRLRFIECFRDRGCRAPDMHDGIVYRTDIIRFRGCDVSVLSRVMVYGYSSLSECTTDYGRLVISPWRSCTCRWCSSPV